jgi:hypothetical protein
MTIQRVVSLACLVLALYSGASCNSGNSGPQPDPFVFAADPASAYTQIDRHAAVEAGTAGIAATAGLGIAAIRDDYNASNPVEDAAGMWVPEITNSVTDLHGALDDDLTGLSLTPASVSTALAQAGPVIVPDVIRYNPDAPTSYPNGRKLTDPVVDLTLAAVLLDLSVSGQTLTTFADLPLNPAANDVAFKPNFPYLADPHAP